MQRENRKAARPSGQQWQERDAIGLMGRKDYQINIRCLYIGDNLDLTLLSDAQLILNIIIQSDREKLEQERSLFSFVRFQSQQNVFLLSRHCRSKRNVAFDWFSSATPRKNINQTFDDKKTINAVCWQNSSSKHFTWMKPRRIIELFSRFTRINTWQAMIDIVSFLWLIELW